MNKFVVAVAQIAIGVFVGSAASDATNGVIKKVQKVVAAKKKAGA